MRRYESQVQNIRYKVIHEITKLMINKELLKSRHKLPKLILPVNKPISRCCVYKEREIISQRVDLAIDPFDKTSNIIEIIEVACDECPVERYKITEACRGCLAHKCAQVCNREAIQIINGRPKIDYDKCVSCGKCKEVCPYDAIADVMRPCMKACGCKAIVIGENQKVNINRDKCTNCGACVYQCPFGAITDRSEIVPIVNALEENKVTKARNIYAVIAPSIASQYHVNIGKVVHAIKKLGFKDVVEAALGADIVGYYETNEFIERVVSGEMSCLMTSCCPSFVDYVKKNYPDLTQYLSTMASPMIVVSRLIKQSDPNALVVFIGPCTSKKAEKWVDDSTDYVLTFEELEAMLDAYGINMNECEDAVLDNASQFGRLFARSGGVKDAITAVLKERNLSPSDFKPIACNGILEIDKALKLLKYKKNQFNFIEGMACLGGCIGGAVCLTHKDNKMVDEYAKLARERTVTASLKVLEINPIELHCKE